MHICTVVYTLASRNFGKVISCHVYLQSKYILLYLNVSVIIGKSKLRRRCLVSIVRRETLHYFENCTIENNV